MKFTLRNLHLLVTLLVGATASAQIPISTSTGTPENPVYIRNGNSQLFVKSNGAASFAANEGAQFVILSAGATDKYKIYNKTSNSWVNATEGNPTEGQAKISFSGNTDEAAATTWRIVQEGTTGKYDIYPDDATTIAWNWNGGATATRAMGFFGPADVQSSWYFFNEPTPDLTNTTSIIIANANVNNDYYIGFNTSVNASGIMNTTLWSPSKALPQDLSSYTWQRIVDGTTVRYYNTKHKLYLMHKGFSPKPYNFTEQDVTFTQQPGAKALWSNADGGRFFVIAANGNTDQATIQFNPATSQFSSSFYLLPTSSVVGLTIKAADYPVEATYTWNGASFTSTNGAAVTIYQPSGLSHRPRTLGITVNNTNYEHRGYKFEGQPAYTVNTAINTALTENKKTLGHLPTCHLYHRHC